MVGPILRSTGVGGGNMAVAGSTGRRDGMAVCSPRERDRHLDDCRDEKSFGELTLAVGMGMLRYHMLPRGALS